MAGKIILDRGAYASPLIKYILQNKDPRVPQKLIDFYTEYQTEESKRMCGPRLTQKRMLEEMN